VETIFDLKSRPDWAGFIAGVNETLELTPEYFIRYGRVGSEQWWQLYDRGRISRTVLAGEITHVGPITDEFDEESPIVRIHTDRAVIDYDLEDFWLHPGVRAGRWVQIERAKTVVQTRTGANTWYIDVRVSLMDEDVNMPFERTAGLPTLAEAAQRRHQARRRTDPRARRRMMVNPVPQSETIFT